MINLNDDQTTEPPLTRAFSLADIKRNFINKHTPKHDIFKLPCYTQAVERYVKNVSESSRNVCGPESREWFIRSTDERQKVLPKFETKSDYKEWNFLYQRNKNNKRIFFILAAVLITTLDIKLSRLSSNDGID